VTAPLGITCGQRLFVSGLTKDKDAPIGGWACSLPTSHASWHSHVFWNPALHVVTWQTYPKLAPEASEMPSSAAKVP